MGEINLERNYKEGEDVLSNSGGHGEIPEFFQSVKSNSNGGFGPFSNQGEELPKDYLNFPYSRAEDYLGASLATPATFFKGNTIASKALISAGLIGKKHSKDIFY